ncbi:hypothetical protein BDK51DRAFT_34494 [Blyttiomyces helicus]|uniref:Uncharacterized protein n=1 Tax=Blyttiomyces helicus TaxID=388810 RepID=A0A4P9WNN8_9FUNG|nr:hypothetical protein BDK51DRAFT_34494 [Blyttiomyces helicus]|eukprot:RKO92810.1 hypothetical protein BDK51DRAFT_34494 [Blyttiomyces helicus]
MPATCDPLPLGWRQHYAVLAAEPLQRGGPGGREKGSLELDPQQRVEALDGEALSKLRMEARHKKAVGACKHWERDNGSPVSLNGFNHVEYTIDDTTRDMGIYQFNEQVQDGALAGAVAVLDSFEELEDFVMYRVCGAVVLRCGGCKGADEHEEVKLCPIYGEAWETIRGGYLTCPKDASQPVSTKVMSPSLAADARAAIIVCCRAAEEEEGWRAPVEKSTARAGGVSKDQGPLQAGGSGACDRRGLDIHVVVRKSI